MDLGNANVGTHTLIFKAANSAHDRNNRTLPLNE